MKTTFFILAFIAICFKHSTNAISVQKDTLIQDASVPLYSTEDVATNFNDYNTDGSRFIRRYTQKSNPTTPTQSPFLSYWQNIMRNVRVPVPSITWNVTNPLANLFRIDQEILETPPLENNQDLNIQRPRKTKRRHKRPNKKHRKQKRPTKATTNGQHHHVSHHVNFQQYSANSNNNNGHSTSIMYFYDPKMNAYFAVQRIDDRVSYPKLSVQNDKDYQEQSEEQPIENEMYEAPETEYRRNDNGDSVENEENDLNKVAVENSPQAEFTLSSNEALVNNDLINDETLRNVLGTFMRDDEYNRFKQRRKELINNNKSSRRTNSKPRKQPNYYLLFNAN